MESSRHLLDQAERKFLQALHVCEDLRGSSSLTESEYMAMKGRLLLNLGNYLLCSDVFDRSIIGVAVSWRCSSVGRALDRPAAEAGSIPTVRQGIFLPESAFSADSLIVSVHPHVHPYALTSVCMLEVP